MLFAVCEFAVSAIDGLDAKHRGARRTIAATSRCASSYAFLLARPHANGSSGKLPRMADVYREKVGSLSRALESEESRAGAVEAIRALIETILLEPDGEQLKITLKGKPGGDVERGRRQQEVARYRRPLGPNKTGCGGGI
ncbi:hypothetical protein [Luteitalea pratensis]|uniref:hypothetical protein n=1 Tax=Luteitalea pratensis TaxID=1855912 RepID=UPI0012FFB759|nr:hypothetical protein [Luteitalea pratensis]